MTRSVYGWVLHRWIYISVGVHLRKSSKNRIQVRNMQTMFTVTKAELAFTFGRRSCWIIYLNVSLSPVKSAWGGIHPRWEIISRPVVYITTKTNKQKIRLTISNEISYLNHLKLWHCYTTRKKGSRVRYWPKAKRRNDFGNCSRFLLSLSLSLSLTSQSNYDYKNDSFIAESANVRLWRLFRPLIILVSENLIMSLEEKER